MPKIRHFDFILCRIISVQCIGTIGSYFFTGTILICGLTSPLIIRECLDAVSYTHLTNLIILRGTSKFFAAPGLRLGYAVTGNQDLIKAINTRKNPWTINSLAEIAGRLMFPDEEYIRHTRELICRERDRLYNELSTWDSVTVYEASANFILMKIRKPGITSQDLFDHCLLYTSEYRKHFSCKMFSL